MKLLVDMNLSPRWIALLTTSGFEALHRSTVGQANARDTEIMAWAAANGYVVLTHDLDQRYPGNHSRHGSERRAGSCGRCQP